jgi:sulfite reductase beta subunit-like hemoprotein
MGVTTRAAVRKRHREMSELRPKADRRAAGSSGGGGSSNAPDRPRELVQYEVVSRLATQPDDMRTRRNRHTRRPRWVEASWGMEHGESEDQPYWTWDSESHRYYHLEADGSITEYEESRS